MPGDEVAAGGTLFRVGQRLGKGCKGHISGIRRVEIDVAGFRESNVVLDSGKSRPDEQRKGKKKPNDGHYNLFFANSNGERMVYFHRKGSYILYLLYLLDRKVREDRVDTLDLARHEALFVRLYDLIYGAGGKDQFATMMEVNDTPGEMAQRNVYSFYRVARQDIGRFCEELREAPEPFLIHDMNSHLAVLPQNITLPPEILSLAKY